MSEIRKKNIPVKKKTSPVHSNHKNNNKSLRVDEYRKLADGSLQGILIIQDERIIYVNDAFAKIIGFSTNEMLSFNEEQIINLIHEPDKNQVWTNYKNRIAGRDIPSRYQIKLKSKSGKIKILDMHSQRFDYKGKPAVQAIFLDITKQVEALKALEESESKFRTIFEHSGVAMVITETDGTMIRVNQAFAKLFGYSGEELEGLNPDAPTYPGDFQQTVKLLDEFNRDKKIISRQIEKKYLDKKGEAFWGLVTATALRNNDGKVINLIGQLQDITKIKNAKKELTKYAKKLKDINSSKDKFFSIISHDLRNPFNALLSNSEYISSSYDELTRDEVKESVNNIYGSAKKIYELIQNLLEWAQVQLGRLEVQKCKINLYDLSGKVINLYKEFTDRKRIMIKNNIDKSIAIYADRNMLETVMRNLFSNAAKFAFNNGSIKISAAKKENFAEISIEDTGIGISAEDQKKLFRIDEQFHTAGTDNERGTGLGLILTKEFVELNGGKISVISKLNSGSKFSFTVPMFDNQSEPK